MYGRTPPYRARNANIVVFAPRLGSLRWVMDELAGEPYAIEGVESATLLAARLTDGPRPHPVIAIADFDSMTAEELSLIEGIRERGWNGTMIALGRPEVETRTALRIRDMIPRPFGSESLRKAVGEIALERTTASLRAIAG